MQGNNYFILKGSESPACPFHPAGLQLCSGRQKFLFDSFPSLIHVKPALNVSTVFACQCGSVCSSLFSDVDSLIACKFSPLYEPNARYNQVILNSRAKFASAVFVCSCLIHFGFQEGERKKGSEQK